MSRPFEARYGGRCAACDSGFREGDMIRYDDDQIVHDTCTVAPPLPPRAMCPRCFTELPVTGVCGTCA